ncbi:MAG: hypothetical protein ACRD9W_09435, partial [Terriglobia bacterium]
MPEVLLLAQLPRSSNYHLGTQRVPGAAKGRGALGRIIACSLWLAKADLVREKAPIESPINVQFGTEARNVERICVTEACDDGGGPRLLDHFER